MNEERINRLKGAGIDVSDALERFMGNEGMMEKFLKKFLTDQNYQKLCDALDGEDFEAALAATLVTILATPSIAQFVVTRGK